MLNMFFWVLGQKGLFSGVGPGAGSCVETHGLVLELVLEVVLQEFVLKIVWILTADATGTSLEPDRKRIGTGSEPW